MKTALELAMEKTDCLAAMADARPKQPDDVADIEVRGNAHYAVVRRGDQLVEERLRLDLYRWPEAKQRSYLTEVSRRLKQRLDGPLPPELKPPHVHKERIERLARLNHARLKMGSHAKRKPQMTAVLNSRIRVIETLADQAADPSYCHRNPENYGRANGLREALATMIGRTFEPLRLPEAWADWHANEAKPSEEDAD